MRVREAGRPGCGIAGVECLDKPVEGRVPDCTERNFVHEFADRSLVGVRTRRDSGVTSFDRRDPCQSLGALSVPSHLDDGLLLLLFGQILESFRKPDEEPLLGLVLVIHVPTLLGGQSRSTALQSLASFPRTEGHHRRPRAGRSSGPVPAPGRSPSRVFAAGVVSNGSGPQSVSRWCPLMSAVRASRVAVATSSTWTNAPNSEVCGENRAMAVVIHDHHRPEHDRRNPGTGGPSPAHLLGKAFRHPVRPRGIERVVVIDGKVGRGSFALGEAEHLCRREVAHL